MARLQSLSDPIEVLTEKYRAHEELVTAAFIEGRSELRPLFYKLFPPPEEVAELRGTPEDPVGQFEALESSSTEARRKAAGFFARTARAEMGMTLQLLLRDPRTVERLLRAAADADEKVQTHALNALGFLIPRTKYHSPALLEALLSLHTTSKRPAVRREIAMAVSSYDDARKWPLLLDALSQRRLNELARRRLVWAARGDPSVPDDVARRLARRLLELLRSEKIVEVKSSIVKTLGVVGDAKVAAELHALALSDVRPELLDDAIAKMRKRRAVRSR